MKNRINQLIAQITTNPTVPGSVEMMAHGISKEARQCHTAQDWAGIKEFYELLDTNALAFGAACQANTQGTAGSETAKSSSGR